VPTPAERRVEKWQRLFFFSIFVATTLLVGEIALEWALLAWLHAGAWVAAGVFSILEGRARRQLSEDGAPAVFRGLACFGFAVLALI